MASKLTRCLLLWWLLGSIYNLLSGLRLAPGGGPLAPTDPLLGTIFISLILGLLWMRTRAMYMFTVLMPLFLVMLAYGGFTVHFIRVIENGSLIGYNSATAFAVAVLLNAFALCCGAMLYIEHIKGGRS